MGIQYLKKAVKTASTDDTKTRDIVQNLLSELEKLVYSDRSKYLGDNDFYPVPKDSLLNIKYILLRGVARLLLFKDNCFE